MGREAGGDTQGAKAEIDRRRETAEAVEKLRREALKGTPAPGMAIKLFKWRF